MILKKTFRSHSQEQNRATISMLREIICYNIYFEQYLLLKFAPKAQGYIETSLSNQKLTTKFTLASRWLGYLRFLGEIALPWQLISCEFISYVSVKRKQRDLYGSGACVYCASVFETTQLSILHGCLHFRNAVRRKRMGDFWCASGYWVDS